MLVTEVYAAQLERYSPVPNTHLKYFYISHSFHKRLVRMCKTLGGIVMKYFKHTINKIIMLSVIIIAPIQVNADSGNKAETKKIVMIVSSNGQQHGEE